MDNEFLNPNTETSPELPDDLESLEKKAPLFEKIVQSISNILHPLLMLTYGAIFIFHFTYLSALPMASKWMLIGEVFFFSLIIPVVCISVLYKLKVVGHWALRNRADRALPLLINAVSYAVCTFVLYRQHMPMWALSFYLGATVLAFVCWFISFWWKISAHAAGLAGFSTLVYMVQTLFPNSVSFNLLMLSIIMTGVVCSIRVYLGRHTLAQVGAGSAAGILFIGGSFMLFA